MLNKEQLDMVKDRYSRFETAKSSIVEAEIAVEIVADNVPALIAEVERLQKQVVTDFFKYGELTVAYEEIAEENKQLREALAFYADRDNHELSKEADNANLCEYINAIDQDGGETARKALGDGDE